jgi:polyphosphate kinase
MFDLAMADTASSWHLESDGEWTRHSTDDDGRPLEDVQNVTMRKISARKRSTR